MNESTITINGRISRQASGMATRYGNLCRRQKHGMPSREGPDHALIAKAA